jgi:uncharacterized RDD family membrane protein YckC
MGFFLIWEDMQKIDITTTQNVIIQYDQASTGERVYAFFIDLILSGAIFLVFMLFINTIRLGLDAAYVVGLVAGLLYPLAAEWVAAGQTYGKKWMKIKVVKLDGRDARGLDYLIRWFFGFIELYFTAGILAYIVTRITQPHQRIGDLVAGTTCISIRLDNDVSLKQILEMRTTDNYTPVYPQVDVFNEEQMLVIKQVLDRWQKYPNQTYQSLIGTLCHKVHQQMGITEIPVSELQQVDFLRQVLSDYIVITRS